MFVYAHVGESKLNPSGLCMCSCHAHDPRPKAVEARLCRECADERFQSWQALVNVLVRDE